MAHLESNKTMKKLTALVLLLFIGFNTLKAQSFSYHQGFDFKSNVTTQKFLADFFWSDNTWNVFSWNNFNVNYGSAAPGALDATALLYVERRIGTSNFFVHPEVRFNTMSENYYQFGFSYLLPFNTLGVYLTLKYSYHARHDVQFSINSSYDVNRFYHEGYFDIDCVSPTPEYMMSFFAEEKFYWKATDNIHLGVNLMFGGNTLTGFQCISPMFTCRISLY